MGRARRSPQGITLGGFDAVLGARRGAQSPAVLSRTMTPEGRAALAPVLAHLLEGNYDPAMALLRKHAYEIDRAEPLQALRETVARHLTAESINEIRPAVRPVLAAAGAGASVSPHIARQDNFLHIIPAGTLDGCSHPAACGTRMTFAQSALAGDWLNASEASASALASSEKHVDSDPLPPSFICPGCAPFADEYPDCEAGDDSAQPGRWTQGYDNTWEQSVIATTSAIITQDALNKEGPYALSSRLESVREQVKKTTVTELERTVALWMRSGGKQRLEDIISPAHVTYYRNQIIRMFHTSSEEDADHYLLDLVQDRCWTGALLGQRTLDREGLQVMAERDPMRVHDTLRSRLRARIKDSLGLGPR